MKYRHTFRVKAPLAAVAEFHSRSASMPAITPPPMIVRVHAAPDRSDERRRDGLHAVGRAGAAPVGGAHRGRVRDGFTDRQVRGPFAGWAHRHTFVRVTDETTDVDDQVEAELKRHLFWGLIGLLMWIGMPALFAYRGWKTRRILEA